MDFQNFIEFAFYGLMSSSAMYMAATISKLRTSIETLNINFAKELEKLNAIRETIVRHENTIDRHSDRLFELEKKSFQCKNAQK